MFRVATVAVNDLAPKQVGASMHSCLSGSGISALSQRLAHRRRCTPMPASQLPDRQLLIPTMTPVTFELLHSHRSFTLHLQLALDRQAGT